MQHSPLDAINPKAVTIMIGTNNIGHGSSTPQDTADGIRAIVDLLQEQYPDAKIFVLYVFPRDEQPDGELRQKVVEINSRLPELVGKLKNVTLIDFGHLFLNDDGVLPKDIMPDFLHPNKEGYLIWAKAVEPILKPIFP
ncbi:MAG: GDSL-type esterase/lipase family protein [Planctomycetaceae bacterium]|nr:GDSL-type esterase/lipase family protein [Planctomycetaceae bacterium]